MDPREAEQARIRDQAAKLIMKIGVPSYRALCMYAEMLRKMGCRKMTVYELQLGDPNVA